MLFPLHYARQHTVRQIETNFYTINLIQINKDEYNLDDMNLHKYILTYTRINKYT